MNKKEKIYKQIESILDKVKIEELIEKLLLIDKIETRINESNNDRTISINQLDMDIKKW